MRMNSSGTSELKTSRGNGWPGLSISAFRDAMTVPNVIGAICCAALLIMLLALPLPWDLRLPLYLAALVWTVLRPRIALYLMAFCIPWGSLDYISVGTLRLDSADILVVFLVIGWLVQWCLPAQFRQQQRVETH